MLERQSFFLDHSGLESRTLVFDGLSSTLERLSPKPLALESAIVQKQNVQAALCLQIIPLAFKALGFSNV